MITEQEGRPQKVYTPEKKTDRVNEGDSSAYHEAGARANMYHFLSAIYLSPPQQAFLDQIAKKDFLEELSSLFGDKGVAELKEFAATVHFGEDLEALRQEYMDLFAVPTGRYVTPFEDVYRGGAVDGEPERGPLLGEKAVAVIRMYRKAGAEINEACMELPTHIGVELSFMSFLCEREASEILGEGHENIESARYRQFQVRFLEEHLNQWFPQLNRSIQKNAKSRFFRGLALITEVFLAQDTANLKVELHSKRRICQKRDGKNGSAKYLGCGSQRGTE